AMAPEKIVISPGPCTPDEAGISIETIRHFAGRVPLLGVCLGHQAIGQALGGIVSRARHVMHGKTSMMYHSGEGVFRGLANPFQATRYHSLIVERNSLPDCLVETAWTAIDEDSALRDEVMGFRHRQWALEGVQFHPESILTHHGHDLLRNFLENI
ncbi:MAG: aminodeoxychorismate/anthranilate synthase component II, partial [Wenzhouxiangellaceae bacterium]